MRVKIADITQLSSSANAFLKNRVKSMNDCGMENWIICMDGPYVGSLRAQGIPVKTLHLTRGYNLMRLILSFFELMFLFRKERFHVVHTHTSVPGFVGRIAARIAGVPVVMHTVHGFHFHERMAAPKRTFYIMVERFAGLFTDLLLSQNKADLEEAKEHRIVPPERLRYIGNGIDLEQFQPGRRVPDAEGCVTITCVARMEKVKNHTMLFEAVRLLKKRGKRFRVWLIGEGELGLTYQELCRRMEIGDLVHFLGYRDDVPDLLAATDIAVLTSLKEGIPRALLEAMAMGIPIVATRVKGTREAVVDGYTGFLVELGDTEALATRLAALISDPELRAEMGRQGREIAAKEFDERTIIDSLRKIYGNLLFEKGITADTRRAQVVER